METYETFERDITAKIINYGNAIFTIKEFIKLYMHFNIIPKDYIERLLIKHPEWLEHFI